MTNNEYVKTLEDLLRKIYNHGEDFEIHEKIRNILKLEE